MPNTTAGTGEEEEGLQQTVDGAAPASLETWAIMHPGRPDLPYQSWAAPARPHATQRISRGVRIPLRRTPSRMGRGGPRRGMVTSAQSSSPVGRMDGSGMCSGMKKATGSSSPPPGRSAVESSRTPRADRRLRELPGGDLPLARSLTFRYSPCPRGTGRIRERHLQPKPDVAAADGEVGIERKGASPGARQPGPVCQQLEAEGADQQHVDDREWDSCSARGHLAGSRTVATSRRRACSSRYPPPRKSRPRTMRLAERPNLSITSEK